MNRKLYRAGGVFTAGGSTVAAIKAATQEGGPLHGLVELVVGIATAVDAGGIEKLADLGMTEGDNILSMPFKTMGSARWGQMALDVSRQFALDHFGLFGCIPTMPKPLILALTNENVRCTNQHGGDTRWFGGVGMIGKRTVAAQLLFERMLPRGNSFQAMAVCQELDPVVDGGDILHYEMCPILDIDDPDSLQARLLPIEHRVQIEALRRAALGQLVPAVDCPSLVRPGEEGLCKIAKRFAHKVYREGFPYKDDLGQIIMRRQEAQRSER